jgi:hypothetical protein
MLVAVTTSMLVDKLLQRAVHQHTERIFARILLGFTHWYAVA